MVLHDRGAHCEVDGGASGYGEHARRYDHVAHALVQAGAVVYAPDHLGHGESEGEFSACTISTWLADAEGVLAAHAPEAPVLIGSSMGGWIACLAARNLAARGASSARCMPRAKPR